jgi:hypothetical protein
MNRVGPHRAAALGLGAQRLPFSGRATHNHREVRAVPRARLPQRFVARRQARALRVRGDPSSARPIAASVRPSRALQERIAGRDRGRLRVEKDCFLEVALRERAIAEQESVAGRGSVLASKNCNV